MTIRLNQYQFQFIPENTLLTVGASAVDAAGIYPRINTAIPQGLPSTTRSMTSKIGAHTLLEIRTEMTQVEDLKNRSTSVFQAYSKYYDLLYSDKDYAGEVDYIHNLLKAHKLEKVNILEFGSGTGKHGRLLGNLGYNVTGVELSKEMVEIAEQSDNFKCLQGDITTINLKNIFDCVLSLFHVVSYLTKNNAITSLFRNANRHLSENGLFIFDVWYSPSVNFNQPEVRVKRMSDKDVEIVRIAEPAIFSELNQVDVNYTIFSRYKNAQSWTQISEKHSMRHFSTPELSYVADVNGFEVLKSEEFKTGATPDVSTWSVCFILKKIRNLD